MKPKTVMLMVIAIGCGLAASYMTSRLLAERSNKEVTEEKVKILVAKKNLPMGTLIKVPEDLFEEKPFTKGEEPKRALRNFEQLKDRRLNKSLNAEQFVSTEDLMDKNNDGLGSQMAKGMRAYGVKVNAESATGGFVLPNSRVDVVWVLRNAHNNETGSKIILQNVLVLAVDTIHQRPDDKSAIVGNTVTLCVTPEQAEKLTLAQELGQLKLILRPFGDEEVVRTQGANPKEIVRGNDSAEPPDSDLGSKAPVWGGSKVPDVPKTGEEKVADNKPVDPPPAPKTHTMTIYNGESVTKAVFVLGDKDGPTEVQIEKSQPERRTEPRPSVPTLPLPPGQTK
jgi:pilus assembly protein CpaB